MGRSRAYVTLMGGVLFVSTAGPFLASAKLDAFAVVFWRLSATTVLLLGYSAIRGDLKTTSAQRRSIALGAVLLATHFLLWIKAFDLTNYASNLLLLVAQPVIAAVVGHRQGEKVTRETYVATALALVGLGIITRGDFALGVRALAGDGLCILAGVAITYFYAVTRDARRELPLPTFLGGTMLVGTFVALSVALVAGSPLVGYSRGSWGWVAALVVVTTIGGHGLFNVAARHLKLFTVNLAVVLEPAIGIAMGAVMFGARITTTQIAGGLVLCLAVAVGLWPAREPGALTVPIAE